MSPWTPVSLPAARASVCGACLALALVLPAPAVAQTVSPALMPRPVGSAMAVAEAPALDGDVLGDPAWRDAPVMQGFIQEQPNEGQPSSERTEVRIVFTESVLYIGMVAYDEDPSGIIVSDARRDANLQETDSFQIIFDTYRDRQNGFVFGTNPAGIEYDGQVTNEGQGAGGVSGQASGSGSGFNINWDGAWEVRARISEIGWSAEFAIPFNTLRYPAGEVQTWGVNFQRNIRRKNERTYWSPTPRQFNLHRVSLAGTLTNISPPSFNSLRLMPYVLGRSVVSGARPASGTWLGDVGGDLKYSLTPSLTLDGTVNTDFAQVEVDDQQVNLDRFNLFFPEKRPFFLENAGFFSVGNQGEVDLFFSRRIGLDDGGQPIDILAGGRVSGKVAGQWNVGFLNMQTAETGPTPSNNFGVIRVSRDLPNRSLIGGIFVNRQGMGSRARDNDYNRTYAVDGRLGIQQHTIVSGFLARTETPGLSGDDYALNLRSRTNTRPLDVDIGYQEVGGNFNPEVGFLTRAGYRKPDVRLMSRIRPGGRVLQEIRPHTSYRGFWGFDDFYETGYWHIDSHWQFRNAAEIHTGMNITHEGVRTPFEIYPGVIVPAGSYDHSEAQFVFITNQGNPISYQLQSFFGGAFGGERVTLNHTLRMRKGETFTSELTYSYNDYDLPGGAFVANLVRTRVNYSFTPRAFVQALVQYNDRADLWSANIRFGWLQAANTGLFIVYNDTRYLYDLVERPERTDRSLVVKFSRLFDVLR